MAYDNTISILIRATDQASAVLQSAAANTEGVAGKLNAAGASMTATGRAMSTGLTAPIVAIDLATAKMAYTFENSMELLHTNAGVAQSAIAGLSNQVLGMAGQVGQAPEALAKGLYHIASAGNGIWNTSQMMDILKVAAEGANLGMANLDDTTYSLTSAMASGVKGVSNATQMMATLNAIVGAGDMKMNDLNAAMSTGILSTAATFGISIQSVGAALATLTDNGEHADEAATRLRMTIALMSSPSSMAAKQLAALGLTAEDAKAATEGMNTVFAKSGLTTTKLADDLRQPNGITVAIQDLKKHLEDAGLSASETDAMLSKAFGGGRTDAALLTMLQNTDRMDAKFKAITDDTGKFQQKLTDLNNTAPQQFRAQWAGVQADLIKLGEAVLPEVTTALKGAATVLTTVTSWFSSLSKGQQQFVVDAGLMVAALGPVLIILGTVASSVSNIITLVGTVGRAFSALPGIVAGATAAVNSSVAGMQALIASPIAMGAIAIAGALADIGLVYEAVQKVRGAIDAMNNANIAAQNAARSNQAVMSELQGLAKNGTPDQQARAKSAISGLAAQGFADGGYTGMGGVNEIAGVVHKGEYVVPQSGVDQKTGLPKAMGPSSQTVNNLTGTFNFNNKESVDSFFDRLDKTQRLAAMGLAS